MLVKFGSLSPEDRFSFQGKTYIVKELLEKDTTFSYKVAYPEGGGHMTMLMPHIEVTIEEQA